MLPRRTCLLAVLLMAWATTSAQTRPVPEVTREEQGNRISENIPAIPPELIEQLNRYQNTRGAMVAGWSGNDCLLVSTRFAETAQAHRVCAPLGMREQLTFYPEPVAGLVPSPPEAWRDGFVFAKDTGGDEFSQLYWFDDATRSTTLLTDGRRSQNTGVVISRDGGLMAYASTARNGTDYDILVRDTRSGETRTVLTEGGRWQALDFSPDGKRLLVSRYVSIAESYPGEVDLKNGELRLFPVDGGKAAFGRFTYAHGGKAVYYVSDEPVDGRPQEFRTLRHHDPARGRPEILSADIAWDVDDFSLADDGRHLAFVTNEDGIGKLHLLSLPDHRPVPLSELPVGLIYGLSFSPDGTRLALAINSATSPSDAYVIDLENTRLTRWTRSEVGGLDADAFVEPTLVHFPSFDEGDGGGNPGKSRRMIPSFYYRPANVPAAKKLPVVIQIHGGPEGQARPGFSPFAQFLVNELGIALLVPNVRGSSGYGKTWLSLDNADKREDSVRDIGALLDWIAQQPDLDAERVGVYGGSYGGYMVLATMTNYPERIRAGVDIVGISHFGTFLKNTEDYRRDLRRAEYGDERDPAMAEFFERISPLNNAGKIASPLFVAQGKNDPRVPWTEAEQIVKAVRGNGQPVWYLLFNDEGHGFRKKTNSDYFTAATMLFWQEYLLGE